jgi:4-hydroxybenzoate polyprenyltransferase
MDDTDARPGSPPHGGRLLAYLQLFRAPNVFTAVADVTMGFLFVQQSLENYPPFLLLMLASSFLYVAGMVLNDVYDFDRDSAERPERPLPSGRISLAWARWLGYELLVVGVILGWCAGWLGDAPQQFPWRAGATATLLAVCVVLYDAVLTQTAVAPRVMGACRFLNVLLGMSVAGTPVRGGAIVADITPEQLLVAGGIGTYIAGVTWFARSEANVSNRSILGFGVLLMVVGIALLGLFPNVRDTGLAYRLDPELVWPAVLFLLSFSILRRCLIALADPQPQRVQQAVRHCIVSLIVLDAAVAMMVADWFWAVAVLALLAPMLLLGRWVYST